MAAELIGNSDCSGQLLPRSKAIDVVNVNYELNCKLPCSRGRLRFIVITAGIGDVSDDSGSHRLTGTDSYHGILYEWVGGTNH